MWHQVDFALCSGFRFRIVAHVSKDSYQDIAGNTYWLSRATLLSGSAPSCVCCIKQHNRTLHGLTQPSSLVLLAFGGRTASCQGESIQVEAFLRLSDVQGFSSSFLEIRRTFTDLLNAFLAHTDGTHNEAIVFRNYLRTCTFQATCSLQTVAAPVPLLHASVSHDGARARCIDELSLPVLADCPRKGVHKPSRTRKGIAAYEFFQAAMQGCLACVRYELELTRRVPPDMLSESNRYSVRDFAKYAVDCKVDGAGAVVEYLDKYWSHLPLQQ